MKDDRRSIQFLFVGAVGTLGNSSALYVYCKWYASPPRPRNPARKPPPPPAVPTNRNDRCQRLRRGRVIFFPREVPYASFRSSIRLKKNLTRHTLKYPRKQPS